jgi:uncharacterized membrane protein YfcA
MPTDRLAPIVVILFAAFMAGAVKGITTMGLGLIAVPIIALFLDVQTAVLSLFASKFLSDVVMLLDSKQDLAWRSALRMVSFVVSGAIAIPVATYLLATLSGKYLQVFLALTILGFVMGQLSSTPKLLVLLGERDLGAGFGLVAGASQALTGVGGPYTAMYLYTLRLTASEFVFLSSIVYLLFDCSQLAAILYLDLYDRSRLAYATMTIAPVMAGTWLGIRVRRRLNPRVFRSALLTLLAASAIGLLLRALG